MKIVNLKKILLIVPIVSTIFMTGQVLPIDEGQTGKYKEGRFGECVPGEIIIKFKPEIGEKLIAAKGDISNALEVLDENCKAPILKECDIYKIEPVFKRKMKKPSKERTGAERDLLNIFKISVNRKMDILAICKELNDPNIVYAEPNYIVRIAEFPEDLPNDRYVDGDGDGEWSIGAIEGDVQNYEDMWGLKKINANRAWPISQGAGVVVAVIDTGIDYTHEDLENSIYINAGEVPHHFDVNSDGIIDYEEWIDKVEDCNGDGITNIEDLIIQESDLSDNEGNDYIDDILGWDFRNNDKDPIDDHYHGSHCAGTIAAVGNNEKGVIGVAPKAKVMAVKGCSERAMGDNSDMSNAIMYAADNGAKIISISWASPNSYLLRDAVSYAFYERGCTIVAAAGNYNKNVRGYYPAGIPEVIAVARMNTDETRSGSSNWGTLIDVIAPGSQILSTNASTGVRRGIDPQNKYLVLGGTSMACPHVSGAAALVLSKNNSFTNEQINQIIRTTAIDISDPLGDGTDYTGLDIYSGYGLINVEAALLLESALECRIAEPYAETIIKNTSECNIKGIAAGPNFLSYFLDYKRDGEDWQAMEIDDPYTQRDGEYPDFDTLGIFRLDLVPDGSYIIKLTARDNSGNVFEDRLLVTSDIVEVATDRKVYNNDETIIINGRAFGTSFESYNIEWGRGEDPVEWFTDGIILENEGMRPVRNDMLGTLDSGFLDEPGWYTLKLEVLRNGDTFEGKTALFIDPEVLSGWPQEIRDNSEYIINNSYPVIAYDALIWSVKYNYISFWNQFGQSHELYSPCSYNTVTLANLDEDDDLEIIAPGRNKITFHNLNNTHVSDIWENMNIRIDGRDALFFQHPVIIDDIDNDEDLDVIAVGSTACNMSHVYIYAWDFNSAELLPGYPVSIDNSILESDINMAIGNLEGDQHKEIIVGVSRKYDMAGIVYILNTEGRILQEICLVDECDDSSMKEGVRKIITYDIDRDGKHEIIVGTEKNVYAFDIDGNMLWKENANIAAYIDILDIDNDGLYEIVTGRETLKIIKLNRTGGIIDTKEIKPDNMGYVFGASLADIDNDGRIEMIVSGLGIGDTPDSYTHRTVVVDVLKYNDEGDTWIIDKSYYRYASPSDPDEPESPFDSLNMPFIVDLDKDGDTEIGLAFSFLTGEEKYYTGKEPQYYVIQIWNYDGEYIEENVKWQYRNYNLQNASCCPILLNLPPVLSKMANKELNEGGLLRFTISATDPNSDFLTYTTESLGEQNRLPEGAEFDSETRIFTWIPRYDQAGTYPVTFSVTDGEFIDSGTITITVHNSDIGPPIAYIKISDSPDGGNIDEIPFGEDIFITVIGSYPNGVRTVGWTCDQADPTDAICKVDNKYVVLLDSSFTEKCRLGTGPVTFRHSWRTQKLTPGTYRISANPIGVVSYNLYSFSRDQVLEYKEITVRHKEDSPYNKKWN